MTSSSQVPQVPQLPLPPSLSPCANIRRSCLALMNDEPCFIHDNQTSNTTGNDNSNSNGNGTRSVIIDSNAMNDLAEKISQSILEKCNNGTERDTPKLSTATSTATANKSSSKDVDSCIDNLDFANWDADGWHYTGSNYSRPTMSKEEEAKQRFERVSLYVMVMDCINFCFWPVDVDTNVDAGVDVDRNADRNAKPMINLLEYEHLASALKELAEADDILPEQNSTKKVVMESGTGTKAITGVGTGTEVGEGSIIKAEDSYALAPQNLIHLDVNKLLSLLRLPEGEGETNANTNTTTTTTTNTTNEDATTNENPNAVFNVPNPNERTRLIIELAQSLLTFHCGSATNFISKANQSADTLVHLILQNFPGFRDTAVHDGRWVAFYKRAQILVADLWAALRSVQVQESGNRSSTGNSSSSSSNNSSSLDYCCFNDMDKITTFADYRVPQLLRHLGVLIYSPDLSHVVDEQIEIKPFCADELYIRAATVVAVDELVQEVKAKLEQHLDSDDLKLIVAAGSSSMLEVNAVKMDWYLWNIGEKLDRNDSLGNHHRVKTIFY